MTTVLLLTPPFTQLNTPYPATAYLKGFLNTLQIGSYQGDLGIEVTNAIFCRTGLEGMFAAARIPVSDNGKRIYALRAAYIDAVDEVVHFLQGKNPTIAHLLSNRGYLPEASRFSQLDDLAWAFGSMGIQDKAKHLSTMFLEDLSDFITECVDEHFGFSRYAERLGRSANTFDEIYEALSQPLSYVDKILVNSLKQLIQQSQPRMVALSVPFPGNLFSSLRCGQYIKEFHPGIKIIMGGGFANTELRSLQDIRVFEFYDYITLDDGEAPLKQLILLTNGEIVASELKRTMLLKDGTVTYINSPAVKDFRQGEIGTPDYSDLPLDKYISAIEVVNPMHRMWSDGRWNKLTMAHGCYWGKCTFCDISLDYIRLYEPVAASVICDRMEQVIAQTGTNGFHFVDEAAPPALMRAVALEILHRKLVVTWWTNIRFEKSFTYDLCLLLKASGCIAVSGGLEVASDRLLALIQKGITVAQVAKVTRNFTQSGIMVHAYLMYGFPTQTAQETIDSLEMVRQMFKAGILQSAYWHQFAMTAHSPVGLHPDKYLVQKETEAVGTFANNDIVHIDPTGTDHEQFTFGLKKSLLNYMHQIGYDTPLHKWFDHKVPATKIPADYIIKELELPESSAGKSETRVVFIGHTPTISFFTQSKKGNQREMAELTFITKTSDLRVQVLKSHGEWLLQIIAMLRLNSSKPYTLQQVKNDYEKNGLDDFELFWDNKPVNTLNRVGLLQL